MTKTMLERAAVALMNRQRNRYRLCSIGVEMFNLEEIERAKDLARAVLMAVREPSEAMSQAVRTTEGWEDMIDFVLNEGAPK